MPTIIKGLGNWSTAQIQALTIPCYCLGAVGYLIVARISDNQQRRGLYSVLFGVVSVIGYGILLSNSSNGVRYFGCFLVAFGLYIVAVSPFLGCFSHSQLSDAIMPAQIPSSSRLICGSLPACGRMLLTLEQCIQGLPLAWLPSNNPRYGKRTTATGLQLTIVSPFRSPCFPLRLWFDLISCVTSRKQCQQIRRYYLRLEAQSPYL